MPVVNDCPQGCDAASFPLRKMPTYGIPAPMHVAMLTRVNGQAQDRLAGHQIPECAVEGQEAQAEQVTVNTTNIATNTTDIEALKVKVAELEQMIVG